MYLAIAELNEEKQVELMKRAIVEAMQLLHDAGGG